MYCTTGLYKRKLMESIFARVLLLFLSPHLDSVFEYRKLEVEPKSNETTSHFLSPPKKQIPPINTHILYGTYSDTPLLLFVSQ